MRRSCWYGGDGPKFCPRNLKRSRHILIAGEPMAQKPATISHFEDLLQQRLREEEELWEEAEPPQDPEPEIDNDTDTLIAEAEASYRKAMTDAGMDPENPPEPSEEDKRKEEQLLKELGVDQWGMQAPEMTRESVVAQFNATKDISGTNLAGFDLSGIDFSGGNLTGNCSCQCRPLRRHIQ
jgi:hypothetical protein